jgi:hypothetical protein
MYHYHSWIATYKTPMKVIALTCMFAAPLFPVALALTAAVDDPVDDAVALALALAEL